MEPGNVLVIGIILVIPAVITAVLARHFPRSTLAVTATLTAGFAIAGNAIGNGNDVNTIFSGLSWMAAYFFGVLALVSLAVMAVARTQRSARNEDRLEAPVSKAWETEESPATETIPGEPLLRYRNGGKRPRARVSHR